MKTETINPTVLMVTDSFIALTKDLTDAIEKTLETYSTAAEAEKAYHVNKLIRRWFAAAGQL